MVDPLEAFHLFGPLHRDAHVRPVEVPGVIVRHFLHAERGGHPAHGGIPAAGYTDGDSALPSLLAKVYFARGTILSIYKYYFNE